MNHLEYVSRSCVSIDKFQVMRIIRMKAFIKRALILAPSLTVSARSRCTVWSFSSMPRLECVHVSLHLLLTECSDFYSIQIQLNQLVSIEFELNRTTVGMSSAMAPLFDFCHSNKTARTHHLRLQFAVRRALSCDTILHVSPGVRNLRNAHWAFERDRKSIRKPSSVAQWMSHASLASNRKETKKPTNPMTIQSHPPERISSDGFFAFIELFSVFFFVRFIFCTLYDTLCMAHTQTIYRIGNSEHGV